MSEVYKWRSIPSKTQKLCLYQLMKSPDECSTIKSEMEITLTVLYEGLMVQIHLVGRISQTLKKHGNWDHLLRLSGWVLSGRSRAAPGRGQARSIWSWAGVKAFTVLAARTLMWTQLLHNPHKHPAALLPRHRGLPLSAVLQDWGEERGKKGEGSESQTATSRHSTNCCHCSDFQRQTLILCHSFHWLA